MQIQKRMSIGLISALSGFLITVSGTGAQTYNPADWVNDPHQSNPNFVVFNANSSSPVFSNNAVSLGTLYGNSPIGATLELSNPGDTITFAGQVALSGELNPQGNMQFRVGLFLKGTNTDDINWLGYMIGNPTGEGAESGLYIRNNPNSGVYASGAPGSAMRPKCKTTAYAPGWTSGSYEFSLSVMQVSAEAQRVSWKLVGQAPSAYAFSGSYTNTFEPTLPRAFDQVGFLGGAALFSSASSSPSINFTNLTVTFVPHKAGDQ